MVRLLQILEAWGGPNFETVLKQAVAGLDSAVLPLQQGLAAGSFALAQPLEVMLIHAEESDDCLGIKVGIFYQSLTPGCACAGDPTVESEQNEYAVVFITIDKQTADATFRLVNN